jgi:hypothetical protein
LFAVVRAFCSQALAAALDQSRVCHQNEDGAASGAFVTGVPWEIAATACSEIDLILMCFELNICCLSLQAMNYVKVLREMLLASQDIGRLKAVGAVSSILFCLLLAARIADELLVCLQYCCASECAHCTDARPRVFCHEAQTWPLRYVPPQDPTVNTLVHTHKEILARLNRLIVEVDHEQLLDLCIKVRGFTVLMPSLLSTFSGSLVWGCTALAPCDC